MVWSFLWRFVLGFVILHFLLGWITGYALAHFGAWGAMDAARVAVVVVAGLLSGFIALGGATANKSS